MKPIKIESHYVVDSNVAIYGSFATTVFTKNLHPLAAACNSFLSRATFHGADLHVPAVFFSEIMNFTYGSLVSSNLYSLEESKVILEEILGTNWEMHIPVWNSVFDMQHNLEYQSSITDAEFLSLADDLNFTFITTDTQLVREVQEANLNVKVLLITDHPWAQSGSVDEFPIDS